MNRAALAAAPLLAVTLLGAGCAAQSSGGSAGANPSSTTTASTCTPASLQTKKSGILTIGTDKPAYPPWFDDFDPTNGRGFEGATAYAVAAQLGYQPSQVKWANVSFNDAIQPGPKQFDFDINEFSITKARAKAVNFSSPYYDVTQAVIAVKGSKADGVTTLAGLKDLQLGAQVGTTSLTAITDVVQPSKQPRVYNNNDDAKAALRNGQIDGLVVDLPTAFFITAAQLDNGIIVGQLPPAEGTPEQFGIVLDKGSSLTSCVSQAVDSLRADGTLKKIEHKWLAQTGGAPVLQ
jgi:polar amino acid transport system substrate-binding protein